MMAAIGLLLAPVLLLSAAGYGQLAVRLAGPGLPEGPAGFSLKTAAGLVVTGWLVFWLLLAGWTGTAPFAVLAAIGVGLALWQRTSLFAGMIPGNAGALPVILGAAVLLAVDVVASLMPVLDADSNAYHFTLPLQFLLRGELFLVPRAVDGATPLFFQSIYGLALKLGGEACMLLTAKLIVWSAALLLYGLVRQHAGRFWAALAGLVFLTMPAVIYGMSGGQVEARIAFLTLAGAVTVWSLWNRPSVGLAVLAGLICGGVAATKFTGLLFAAAAGAGLLVACRQPRLIAAFAIAGLVAGGQWYVWLWIETGTPVFPMFAGLPYWDASHAGQFADRILRYEAVLPIDLAGLFSYPFHAYFATREGFESARTGLGPTGLVLLPAALLGCWRLRRSAAIAGPARDLAKLLTILIVISGVYYLLWWFLGSSQRIRHLLPVVPLATVFLVIAAVEGCRSLAGRRSLALLLAASAVIQLGGWAFYHRATIRFAAAGFDREAVLAEGLLDYRAIGWMNGNLGPDDILVLLERRNNFYLRQPFYRLSSDLERLVSAGIDDTDPERFLREVRSLGGTHILFHLLDNPAFEILPDGTGHRLVMHADIDDLRIEGNGIGAFHQLVMKLLRDGCGRIDHLSRTQRRLSRTMDLKTGPDEMVMVVRLKADGCAYPRAMDEPARLREHTDWVGGPRGSIPFR